MASGPVQFLEPTRPPHARCAFCFQPVGGQGRTPCPQCRALYHFECWKANDGHCAVYGCHRPAPVSIPAAPSDRWIPLWGGTVAVVLIIAALYSGQSEKNPPPASSSRLERIRAVVALTAQGSAKQERGDLDGAIADYSRAIELESRVAVPFHNRAVAWLLKNDLGGAWKDYSRALELDPNYASAWRGRGHVRHLLGDHEGAIEDCTRAINLDASDGRARHTRAGARLARGDTSGAILDFTREIEIERNGKPAPGYAGRGQAKKARGDLDGARLDFDRALELDPASASIYHDRGHLRTELRDLDGAIADFTRAFELDPSKPEPLYDRACRQEELRRWSESLKDFERACQIFPEARDRARLRIFLLQARLGNRAAALKDLASYLERREPASNDAWSIDLLRFAAGRLKEQPLLAAAATADTPEARGRRCEAYYYAGTLRLLAGDPKTARTYLARSVETGATTKGEYFGAVAELRFLGRDD